MLSACHLAGWNEISVVIPAKAGVGGRKSANDKNTPLWFVLYKQAESKIHSTPGRRLGGFRLAPK